MILAAAFNLFRATVNLLQAKVAQRPRKWKIRLIIDSERQRSVERNRASLVSIVNTLITCARQNIGICGHCDDVLVDLSGAEPLMMGILGRYSGSVHTNTFSYENACI